MSFPGLFNGKLQEFTCHGEEDVSLARGADGKQLGHCQCQVQHQPSPSCFLDRYNPTSDSKHIFL